MTRDVVKRYVSAFTVSIALHLGVIAGLVWLASHPIPSGADADVSASARTASRSRPMMIVHEAPPESLDPPARAKPKEPADPTPADLGIQMDETSATLDFASFSFDAGKIINRAGSLFPFLTHTFSFDRQPPRDAKRASDSLINPFAPPRPNAENPPLELTDAQLQALVDRTWSRRHRWEGFKTIADLAADHDPNQGRLPVLMRAYVDQNALQPYSDRGEHDPRLWTQLGLAADHSDFTTFVSRYVEEHPSTRTSTELLFLLEKQAEASLDTLVMLLDINPERDLAWTRRVKVEAFDAIVAIRRHYMGQLARRDMMTRDALIAHYDKARIEILSSVLRTTPDGYRENDARFLIGAIHWRSGRLAEALHAWMELRVNSQDRYARASAEVVEALRESAARGGGIDVLRINRILDGEQGRWIMFSYDRLRQFGYRFDTF